jgi:hypothetical protein
MCFQQQAIIIKSHFKSYAKILLALSRLQYALIDSNKDSIPAVNPVSETVLAHTIIIKLFNSKDINFHHARYYKIHSSFLAHSILEFELFYDTSL